MAKKKIVIKSYLNIRDQKVSTAVAITPGHLVERIAAGTVQKHSTAAGPAERLFALPDDLQGKDWDEAYAVSVPIQLWNPTAGDRVNAIHDATSGGALTIGEFVESAGDGTVRGYTAQASGGAVEAAASIIGVALEAAVAGARVVIGII